MREREGGKKVIIYHSFWESTFNQVLLFFFLSFFLSSFLLLYSLFSYFIPSSPTLFPLLLLYSLFSYFIPSFLCSITLKFTNFFSRTQGRFAVAGGYLSKCMC